MYLFGGAGIEIAGRLVGKEQQWPVGKRARNGHALLFAAGKFGRTMIEPRGQAEPRQAGRGRAASAACGFAPAMSCGIMTFSSAENSGSR